MSRRHSLLRATCLGAALLLWVPLAWSQPADHLVKAASIYKVAQFTTWAEVLPEGASMTLCVFGKDEVGASLEAFNGSLVAGHPLSVQAARDASSSCMIAYLAESERCAAALTARLEAGATEVSAQSAAAPPPEDSQQVRVCVSVWLRAFCLTD